MGAGGTTTVDKPAARIGFEIAAYVSGEGLKFPNGWPSAISRGVHPCLFLRFQISILTPLSTRNWDGAGTYPAFSQRPIINDLRINNVSVEHNLVSVTLLLDGPVTTGTPPKKPKSPFEPETACPSH